MVDTGTSVRPVHDDGWPTAPRRGRRLVVTVVAAVVALAVLATALLLGVRAWRGGAEQAGVPGRLTWAPPTLEDPVTVDVTEDNRDLQLEPDQDYIVRMPDEPLDVRGGLVIVGGRDVVLRGGEIRITEPGEDTTEVRGLLLKDQTGTAHVEGLYITGPELAEGIDLDQRVGGTVQLQNIRIDTVHGAEESHHADVIQSWAGPAVLRVDRLTGRTNYQGLFLLPRQFLEEDPDTVDLRHVNIVGEGGARYMLWRDGGAWDVDVRDVWVAPPTDGDFADERDPEALTWATDDAEGSWAEVRVGVPPGGDFVPDGRAGLGYESPGYLDGDGE
ncbi:hypothetical protein [Cellulomonas aerilata]|uniref:Uncharacterized protein n=1 Tax=Cellulomonas aerilata TaxID=515326 RepID=A0A512DF49_9CELL|nr:hypothetical protein [Cellulomonas aerilata]GEO35066.1 hypothetical protein CAE01nite_27910 [Cellulomonas aerilata]